MPRLPRAATCRPRTPMGRRACRQSHAVLNSDDDDFVLPRNNILDDGKFVPPTSRCILLAVWSVVKEMGFAGLLKVPNITNYREFSLWLLSRVDCANQAIRARNEVLVRFSDEDINKVLGIPCSGRDITELDNTEIVYTREHICKILKVSDVKHINRRFLYDIFEKKHDNPMTKEEIEVFKVAYVIHAVTKFLAPQSMHDLVCARYFGAIVSPDDIGKYNWASYVIKDILMAADTVQKKLSINEKISYINGCVIFLQVLYLEHLEFGGLNNLSKEMPRIASYTEEESRKRSKLDFVTKSKSEMAQFGKLQVRPTIRMLYSKLANHSNHSNRSFVTDGENKSVALETFDIIKRGEVHIRSIFEKAKDDATDVLTEVTRSIESMFQSKWLEQTSKEDQNLRETSGLGASGLMVGCPDRQQGIQKKTAQELIKDFPPTVVHEKCNPARNKQPIVSTPHVTVNNVGDEQRSIDLNKSFHPTASEASSSVVPKKRLVDIPAPSFDLGIDSPRTLDRNVSKESLDSLHDLNAHKESIQVGKTAAEARDQIKDEKNNDAAATSPVVIKSSPELSPRSASREYAQAFIVAGQMIIDDDKKQKDLCTTGYGLKREPPEPMTLNFSHTNNKRRCDIGVIKDSPFDSSVFIDPVKPRHLLDEIHSWIMNKLRPNASESDWIAHPTPNLVTLSGQNLHELSKPDGFVGNNTCLIYIRRLTQIDQELCAGTPAMGWRHFLNIDFSMHALADEGFWDPHEFHAQFIHDTINYNVLESELVFVPVFNLPRTYCYVFHLKKHVVQILDPLNTETGGDSNTVEYHSSILPLIVKAMQQCMSMFFTEWTEDISKWNFYILDGYTPTIKCRSVFHMLHCLKTWNGKYCTQVLHQTNILDFQKEMVSDLLHTKANIAKPPQDIERILRQKSTTSIIQID